MLTCFNHPLSCSWRQVFALFAYLLLIVATSVARSEEEHPAASVEDRLWEIIVKGDVGDDRKKGETIYVIVRSDSDVVLEKIAALSEDDRKKIWRVGLSDPHLTERSVKTLRRLPGLRILHIDIPWKDKWSPHLSDLPLTQLWMQNCEISGVSLQAIGEIETLEFLLIADNPIASGDFHPLSKLKAMRELHLDETPIEDRDTEFLTNMPNLSLLGLNETKISDESVPRIIGCRKLTLVRLVDTRITKEGYSQVRKSLPNAIMVHRTKD